MAAGFFERLGVRVPLVVAPMAGGPSTPALVSAVSTAGALGSLACAYSTSAQIERDVAAVRALTQAPFAINLFALHGAAREDPPAVPRVQAALREFRLELGLAPEAVPGPPAGEPFVLQLQAVLRTRPAVFSFTFGVPRSEDLRALRREGIAVVGTATNVAEGVALEAAGVDAICAQGAEAGAHRGTFIGPFEEALIGTATLVQQLFRRVRVPIIAAGGLMDGQGIAAVRSLGAVGAQLGTAFLGCPEAAVPKAWRDALSSPLATRTVVTRAFSGRPARGIRNRMTDAFAAIEPAPFPQQSALTAELRATAAKAGRTDLMQLWAGQGAPLVRPMPAAELVALLASELAEAERRTG
jgi:nitronate monooxygenase